jgi:uracil-DNA glycosylase family 4
VTPRPVGPAARRARLTPAHPKPHGLFCDACVLRDAGAGYVPSTGAPSKIHLIGEAPGYDEVAQGAPFVGAAGSMLTRVLRIIGAQREHFRIDNVLRCCPPDFNIARFPAAIPQCQYRAATLSEGPEVVITLGATATKAILGFPSTMKEFSIEDFHGTVTRDPSNRFWVVPSFHPSYLQRGATNLMGVSAFDIARGLGIVRDGGWAPDPGQLWLDPPLDWFAAWAETYLAAVAQDPYAYPLAVDIETPEKGSDEAALVATVNDATYVIKRVNFSDNPDVGITVPYEPGYIQIIHRVLAAAAVRYFWYKGYDEPRLRAAGHLHPALEWNYDLMWAAKALQSDLPGGLGFWAPLYSRWGAWKHLSKGPLAEPVKYAGVDGIQTRRTGDGILGDLIAQGRYDVFARHMHRFHAIVLQPATDIGVPIDRARLLAFKAELDVKAGALLTQIADRVPQELCPLTPKAGLTRPPTSGEVHTKARATTTKGVAKKEAPDPLKMLLYSRAKVIEKLVIREVNVCLSCLEAQVAKTHRCKDKALTPNVQKQPVTVTRWFWQEPFNPDSPPQLMAYALAQGHKPGKSKQTGEDSMDRETLGKLYREHQDEVYSGVLDYRGVAKVRGTYVLATERQMDSGDRLHGTFGFKPSTMRLNGTNPNLQNVVADKGGQESLAAGFRKCVVARGRWVEAGSGWEDINAEGVE